MWRAKKKKEEENKKEDSLLSTVSKNLEVLKEKLHNSSDCVFREFVIGDKVNAAMVYIDGLTDKKVIHDDVIRPLMFSYAAGELPRKSLLQHIEDGLLIASDIKEVNTFNDILGSILLGDAAVIVDGEKVAIIVSSKGFPIRSVTEPQTESVIRGPREGFTEAIRINTALLRRKIHDPDLVFENLEVGVRTKTSVVIAYVKDLAKEETVNEVRRRIKSIDIDGILDSGYIEQLIEDNPFSPFATTGYSEKPDVIAGRILEGRLAVFVDGSPIVLTIPMLFIENFQTAEDYYSRPFFISFVRLLRYLGFFISIIAPAFYVALTSFHQELLPTPLLISIAAASEGTPFPAVVEVGVMEVLFEILREAGLRMPRAIGQAVSIVGALVIGQATVSAGLVGEPLIIVIAITAITAFLVPTLYEAGTLLRIGFYLLAATFGLIGIGVGFLVVLVHLSSLHSYGVPFMSPIMPLEADSFQDVLIRSPLWTMKRRPRVFGDGIRQGENQKPVKERDMQ
jgi:spore germination protein KA